MAADSLLGSSTPELREQARAAFARGGRTGYLRWALSQLLEFADPQPVGRAYVHAELGESEAALDWLEVACDQHHRYMPVFLYERSFVRLHDHPRGRALLERMGLTQEVVRETLEILGLNQER